MTELTACPNCGTQLKSSLLGSVSLVSEGMTKLINEYHDQPAKGYCTKCYGKLKEAYAEKLEIERMKLEENIKKSIHKVPIVTAQNPLHWDYTILNMVTSQSTTGTGVITEIASSFTDFFGQQSGRINRKLKEGEEVCLAQLRQKVLEMGGNAIIAADIDYAEVGGDKGMLMICISGTAIDLKNVSILGPEISESIANLQKCSIRMSKLNELAGSI